MLACSSSFTVFLTTPCRPLIPAMRILGGDRNRRSEIRIFKWIWLYLANVFSSVLYSSVLPVDLPFSSTIFNCSKTAFHLFSSDVINYNHFSFDRCVQWSIKEDLLKQSKNRKSLIILPLVQSSICPLTWCGRPGPRN